MKVCLSPKPSEETEEEVTEEVATLGDQKFALMRKTHHGEQCTPD